MAQSQDSNSLLNIDGLKYLIQARVAIIYTEWNDTIVAEQLKGARKILNQSGAKLVKELAVPGCFEIPFAAAQLWNKLKDSTDAPEAVIAFGAVIRGGTPHFDYVCKAVTEGIVQFNMQYPVPLIFGVLTLDNEAQAWERLGGAHGHKGEEAAITALKMIQNSRAYSF